MSFSEDSSDSDWKDLKLKSSVSIKQENQSAQNKPKYTQKFCDKWLKIFNPWLARCEDDANKPFCRACQCKLDCNRCHLQRHERTTKHARNLEILVNKGEGAARQNLSIRQERSKYYQQRKKNTSLTSSQDASDVGMDTTEDIIEEYVINGKSAGQTDADGETGFQFVHTESAPGDQYTEETVLKQETASADGNGDPIPARSSPKGFVNIRGGVKKSGEKKERIKLLMQIQKDKNDLMDSFKELMGGGYPQPAQKEKSHVDLFFESVSSSVKALSPKLIAETKMRVSQLICELELRELTENDVNNTGLAAAGTAVVVSPEAGNVGNAFLINQPVTTVVHGSVHHTTEDSSTHFESLS